MPHVEVSHHHGSPSLEVKASKRVFWVDSVAKAVYDHIRVRLLQSEAGLRSAKVLSSDWADHRAAEDVVFVVDRFVEVISLAGDVLLGLFEDVERWLLAAEFKRFEQRGF